MNYELMFVFARIFGNADETVERRGGRQVSSYLLFNLREHQINSERVGLCSYICQSFIICRVFVLVITNSLHT